MSEYITEWVSDKKVGMVPYGDMHEEIVRCKDCVSFREKGWRCTSYQWYNCDELPDVEPDGFCA